MKKEHEDCSVQEKELQGVLNQLHYDAVLHQEHQLQYQGHLTQPSFLFLLQNQVEERQLLPHDTPSNWQLYALFYVSQPPNDASEPPIG